jgi:hypothetical protein
MPEKKKARAKSPKIYVEPEPLRLDLGSGDRPSPGFKGVDVSPVTDFTFDLCDGKPWPFKSDSVDEMRSSHFVEHIDACYLNVGGKRIDALLWFFDEAFRIAKPGAVFTVIWPALQNVRAFQDPTHRRYIPAETVSYLCRDGRNAMGLSNYGAICNWIGTVVPTIPIPAETDEDRELALKADSSDAKQAWLSQRQAEQQRRYVETWNYSQDFIATLKAVKG